MMKTRNLLLVFVLLGSAMVMESPAQETAATDEGNASAEQSDREQLRLLREALTEAVVAGDVEKQIEYVVPDVVTIWQNNQVARGHDGLRDLMSDIKQGEDSIFQGYAQQPTSDEVTILPGGNTAIAYGKSVPHYKWLGQEFDLENRWSATLVKSGDRWKIATYHVSGNLTDNPVLSAAKQSLYWVAGIALLGGIVLGAVGSRMLVKSRPSTAQ